MSGNLFGSAFRVMTFGESHGPYIGLVIDGIRPGLEIDAEFVQEQLNRRRPGQSDIVTTRKEEDRAEIISGIFEGRTTGTPLCILIRNQDQRSRDYSHLQHILRPGHASFTFLKKYGVFDFRGGGRASGRETATRVAAGAVARQLLKDKNIEIFAHTKQIGDIIATETDLKQIERNPVRAADAKAAEEMIRAIRNARDEGDSLGGIVEIIVKNCPAGLGEPVFDKLEADLAKALLSIGAVKSFEMGNGFDAAVMKGSEFNDLFYYNRENLKFSTRTNRAGGVLGGISNGEDLVMRIAVKPPSSIGKSQKTVTDEGKEVVLDIGGRHDPCICPRVVPVAEAMVALVLTDHLLMQERITSGAKLQNVRSQIDTIDGQLMLLLAQRQIMTRKIAAIKKQEGLSIVDEKRESDKKVQMLRFAEELELSEDLITNLFDIILRHSHSIQKDSML
ncbi:MAG: chorismate synthase [Calditrichaeota bacterium]|nr:chorismate synthase [Calditrichota bacterium]RQV93098.1 MAG: chorismate synthase [bacterium]RQW04262.1 MAG: chorismate synthase [Calditrichota bacterium]